MSSFPPSDSSSESPWTEAEKRETSLCHECGEHAVHWVKDDCKLLDGTVVPDLERLQCASCGANLFDLAAMRRIRKFRDGLSVNRPVHKVRRKSASEVTHA